jgi:hypothetical protein
MINQANNQESKKMSKKNKAQEAAAKIHADAKAQIERWVEVEEASHKHQNPLYVVFVRKGSGGVDGKMFEGVTAQRDANGHLIAQLSCPVDGDYSFTKGVAMRVLAGLNRRMAENNEKARFVMEPVATYAQIRALGQHQLIEITKELIQD